MPAHAQHSPAWGAHANAFTRQRPRLPSRPGSLTLRQPGRPGEGYASPVAASARSDERIFEILVDRLFWDAEGPPDPYRLQLPGVDQPVDRHLGHAHDRGDFRYGQEPNVAQRGFIS